MRIAVLLAVLLAAPWPAPRADDRVQTTEGTGQAPLAEGALAARAQARDDALRSCVEAVVAPLVTAAGESDQAELLAARILAASVGYVRRFRIVDDRPDGDAWRTTVRCDVARGKLEEDLLAAGIAYRRPGLPRVLVLVAEGGPDPGARVLAAAVARRLAQSGFTVVDAAGAGDPGREELADGGVERARPLGASAGAEVVVIGRAIVRPLATIPMDDGALHSVVASVTARAVRTDSGEVLATVSLTGAPGYGLDAATAARSALSEGGKGLAREVFSGVGTAWARDASGTRRIALAVRGVVDYARLAAFKGVLVQLLPDVRDVRERSLEDGRAVLDVELAGTSEALATELATRKLPGFAVKVLEVTQEAVEVALR
jgi:hypothetical protein